jgi:hypothetical protein
MGPYNGPLHLGVVDDGGKGDDVLPRPALQIFEDDTIGLALQDVLCVFLILGEDGGHILLDFQSSGSDVLATRFCTGKNGTFHKYICATRFSNKTMLKSYDRNAGKYHVENYPESNDRNDIFKIEK